MAIEPSAVTIQDKSEIAPTWAMFVGSMMMPEPIMFTATMKVSWTRFIFFWPGIVCSSRMNSAGHGPSPPGRKLRTIVLFLHAIDVIDAVLLLGTFDFLRETGEAVAVLLQGAQVGEPRAV